MFEFAPLIQHALELSGVEGRAPRICHIGTAGGDQQYFNALFSEAGQAAGITVTHLNLFPMPSAADPAEFLLGHDVVWVSGGLIAPPAPPDPVHLAVQVTVTEVWYWLRGCCREDRR